MLSTILKILVMAAVLMAAQKGQATLPAPASSETIQCRQQLNECEELLFEADQIVQEQKHALSLYKEHEERLSKVIQEEQGRRERAEAWYRQPSFVGPLALILGLLVGAGR
jgi:hypothetical protein